MGTTTDHLVAVSKDAERGHAYQVWKQIKELQEYHLNEAHRVVNDVSMARLEASLRRQFRDLHVLLLSVAEEGRPLSPALKDEVLSFGERLSSEVVTAALQSSGIPAVHLDSRQVILTDTRHTQAQPLLWETYAKMRRVIPILLRDRVVVMGGFIGATEDGVTTTMGRGGSDLTATLVGAGISADEVQVWKDVDGMLTCDPKLLPGGYRLKTISYAEAAAMAQSGAKLLHPETVSPVIRQRIPIVIRNSRRPDIEGTSIVPAAHSGINPVKCISCKPGLTVIEIRSEAAADSLRDLCERHHLPVEFSGGSGNSYFLAVKSSAQLDSLGTSIGSDLSCVEARVHSHSAVIALVGQGIAETPGLAARVASTLRNPSIACVPDTESGLKLSLIVPQPEMQETLERLHREFFQRADPAVFVESTLRPAADLTDSSLATSAARRYSNRSPETRSFPREIRA